MNNQYELYHHGIKGQKWGVRRFQNADGSLTRAGLKRRKLLLSASDKAEKFAQYARDDQASFRRMKEGKEVRQRGVTDRDLDRWIETSKKGEKFYSELSSEFKNREVASFSKKNLKAAERFVKKDVFINADFGDFYNLGTGEIKNLLYQKEDTDRAFKMLR